MEAPLAVNVDQDIINYLEEESDEIAVLRQLMIKNSESRDAWEPLLKEVDPRIRNLRKVIKSLEIPELTEQLKQLRRHPDQVYTNAESIRDLVYDYFQVDED